MAGPGSVLAFEVTGGFEAARRVLEAVKIMVSAVSLGSTDTLIQHPAGLTHRCVADRARSASGISESLLRLSVGLEDPEDLWADLEQALAHAGTPRQEPAGAVASSRPEA
jgi:cystathionine beta-lyase/cystathionine gamma-synthase